MKIMSWNVRGLGAAVKRQSIKHIITKHNPDIIVLQETKKESFDRSLVASIWGSRHKGWVILPAEGSRGGIAIIWDVRRTSVVSSIVGSFSVSIEVEESGGNSWWLSGVYGPCNTNGREAFWGELGALYGFSGSQWCIAGDFNVPRYPTEKTNCQRTNTSMRQFDRLIREMELVDLNLSNGIYTWSNLRMDPLCARLDRIMFTKEWGDYFQFGRQYLAERIISDHFPIILETGIATWGPTPFRFENMWLQDRSFKTLFREWWRSTDRYGGQGYSFMMKLAQVKGHIQEWNRVHFGHIQNKKHDLTQQIKALDNDEGNQNWDEVKHNWRKELKGDLEHTLLMETQMNHQKLKIKWVKEGDSNSKFFHRLLNARKGKNFISRMQLTPDTFTEDPMEIENTIINFYQNLYSNQKEDDWEIQGITWDPISMEAARLLEANFTEQEVWEAINQCEGDKAPGPDGFSMAVYKEHWGVMKHDIMAFINEFYRNGKVSSKMNETYICLIPKGSHQGQVTDYRPISLISSPYKILAKVLATRIRKVLPQIIAKEQNAFTPGRQMLDSVLIASETIEFMKSKRQAGFVLKLDFAKAYDCVDWKFLDYVMRNKGFGSRWCNWIRGCVSSANFSILINGRPRGKFRAQRGLRQGDPLSPFLFIIVADVMGRMIEAAKERGVIHGMKVGREAIHVSHLQFADDSLLFIKGTSNMVQNMMRLVHGFCGLSGLQLNLFKSQLLGINLPEELVQSTANGIGCAVGAWPMNYLGMPLGGSPYSENFWMPVIQKIAKRLESWKGGCLSKGGRLILINSVLEALPNFYMSLFKLPVRIAQKMEQLMRNFLWQRFGENSANVLVAWDKVTKPKDQGGLGIGNLLIHNKALLGKWVWRYQSERQVFWAQIIHSIYGTDANGWEAGSARRATHRAPWKAISAVAQEINRGATHKLGNGRKIRFWHDQWLDARPLKDEFPLLFNLARTQESSVASMITEQSRNQYSLTWGFNFRRRLNEAETAEYAILIHKIETTQIHEQIEDRRVWKWDDSGRYTVNSAFRGLLGSEDAPISDAYHSIWRCHAPNKYKFLSWLVWMGRINVSTVMQRRWPTLNLQPSRCVLCKNHGEDLDHLFLNCEFTMNLWQALLDELNLSWVQPRQVRDCFEQQVARGRNTRRYQLWGSSVQAIIWWTWAERNRRIFEQNAKNWEEVWEAIHRSVASICFNTKEFKHLTWSDIMGDWKRILHGD